MKRPANYPMQHVWHKNRNLLGLAVFALAFLYVWWIAGDLFNLGVDEGIYLEGGRRVARGDVPYRDFFALTGPLTFCIEGWLARLGGASIVLMRLSMILDMAFLTWAVYWLAAQFEGPLFSAGLAMVFLAYESKLNQLVVNHRWDSAALATAAVAVALAAGRKGGRSLWLLSGLLAGGAAWATPSAGLVAVPLFVWSVRRSGGDALAFLGGGALVTAAAAGYLESRHGLGPMIESMRWTAANYTGANRVSYGWVTYQADRPFAGLGGPALIAALLAHIYHAIPAILPPAALAGWGWRFRRHGDRGQAKEIILLLAAAVAMVLSAWPRWSAQQLIFVAAIPWVLCGVVFHRCLVPRWRPGIYAAVLFLAAGSAALKSAGVFNGWSFPTRAGSMRGSPDDATFLEPFERHIQPGDTLFVFPYLPALYALLDARNPTRYSFLQPGMMTAEDERAAIADLEVGRPQWLVREDIPPDVVFSTWPGSDPSRVPMEAMHTYMYQHYREVEAVHGKWGDMIIMRRTPAQGNSPQP